MSAANSTGRQGPGTPRRIGLRAMQRRGENGPGIDCVEVVEVKGSVRGSERAPVKDTAKKAAQKNALTKARDAATAKAAILLDDYYCADNACPDSKLTITYTFTKARFEEVEVRDPDTGLTETLQECKIKCSWTVTLECVAEKK